MLNHNGNQALNKKLKTFMLLGFFYIIQIRKEIDILHSLNTASHSGKINSTSQTFAKPLVVYQG